MREYTLDTRELGALVLVILALLVVAFFIGVNVGERHERARGKGKVSVVSAPTGETSKAGAKPGALAQKGTKAAQKAGRRVEKGTPAGVSGASKAVLKRGYYVQVGAFKEKVWAEKWRDKVRARGYRVLVLYSSARGVHRVVIGPYSSKELAVRVARKVDGVFKVRSSVVPDSRLR